MDHIIHYDPELPGDIKTPCYVVDTKRLRENLEVLQDIQEQTDCRILGALKGFAMHSVFPIMKEYLAGTCASGPHEARLGFEEFGKEVHAYAPAYSEQDMEELIEYAHHISFNSFNQLNLHRETVEHASRKISYGLRVNPEYSEVETELYNPCAAGSRLGVKRDGFEEQSLEGIEGLHFHTMCEENADTLKRTLENFEEKFGDIMARMKWVNFGGGHHITSPNYDVDLLIDTIMSFQNRHPHLQVYMEPGEALAINTGVLVAQVLDIIEGETPIAILDVSATCHMPDVLEMPYRAEIYGADKPDVKAHNYKLGGLSCLAGDIIGDYSFDKPLEMGDRITFLDMAHYTMVKTTTFNGIKHPSIATWDPETKELEVVREFGYEDYKNRLS